MVNPEQAEVNMCNDNTTVRNPPSFIQPYSDAELDKAMRDLEELEAEEAALKDLGVLRQHWARRMAAVVVGALALCIGAGSAAADAPPKPKKPTLCMSGTPVTGERFAGFLCTDGKRPKLFTSYIEVQFADENGNPASYVLGWTGAPKKPIPLPKKLPKDERPTKPASTVKL